MQYLIDEGFDYVLVYRSSQQLQDEYGSLFEGEPVGDEQIWSVSKESRTLIPVY